MSLATIYRPKTFSEVCSQKSIVNILQKQIELKSFKNAYIFYGASGCGKTTLARIFANEINNNLGSPIEIDAASNNGVDNVKQIISLATERSIDSEYKIYIIDEAHSLTTQAWQAFLKCIEEPPKYTIFIFCTTEKNKIPETVKNRCIVFNFTLIPYQVIFDRLCYICEQEGFTNYRETCDYISRITNGCLREAISLLEQVSEYDKNLSIEKTLFVLGNYSDDQYFELINNLIDGNTAQVITIIENIYNSGNDLKLFVDKFFAFCLDIAKYCICKDLAVTKFPSIYIEKINNATNFDTAVSYYSYVVDRLLELKNMLKNDIDPKSTLTVKLINIAECK